MKEFKRFDWPDFMRGLFIVLVVMSHCEVYYYDKHMWNWVWIPISLPGFTFISGYLFTKDINSVSLRSKIKQVTRALLIPYFIFTILFVLPKIVIIHAEPVQLLRDIFLLRASWAVMAIAVLQILYAIVLRVKPSVVNLIISTLFFSLIGYGLVLLYRESPSWLIENQWLHSQMLPNRLPLCINIALIQSPFFAIGILYRRYEKSDSVNNIACTVILFLTYFIAYLMIDKEYIGSSMCVTMHRYNNVLLLFLYSCIGISAVIHFSKIVKVCKPINYIGRNSILFYFFNGWALTLSSMVMRRVTCLNPANFQNQMLVTLLAFLLMFPCVWLINRYIPILRGDKDSFNKLSERLGLKINW